MSAAPGRKKYGKSDLRPAAPRISGKAELKAFAGRAAELAETALAPLGLELIMVQCPVEGGRPVLRLFIDRMSKTEEGAPATEESDPASAVTLDDCAAASRAMDAALEGDDREPPEGYVLEVSSPGLDRPLVKPADYLRFAGRLVNIKLRRDGQRRAHKGRLVVEADGGPALDTADGRIAFSFEEVISCRLSLDAAEF